MRTPAANARSPLHPWLEPLHDLRARSELIGVLLIAAETTIIYLYLGVVLPTYEAPLTPVPALLVFTMLFLAYMIPRVLDILRIWTPEYETVMAIGLALTLLLALKVGAFPDHSWLSASWLTGVRDALIFRASDAIRPAWGLVILTVYVWWRGRMRAEPVIDTAYTMLRWGTLFMAGGLVLVWVGAPPEAGVRGAVSVAVIGYVVFTLSAIAVARVRSMPFSTRWRIAWVWMVLFGLPIVVIALLTISTAGIFSREALDALLRLLQPVFWTISLVLRAIILILAILTFVIIAPILWFIERQNLGPFPALPNFDLAPRSTSDLDEFARNTLDIADPVRYLVVSVVFFLIGSVLVRYLFRRRRRWQPPRREQHESLLDWEEQSRSIGQRVRALVGWLAPRGDPFGSLRGNPVWLPTIRVRRAYRRYLRRASRAGARRPHGMTPSEFAERVGQVAPEVKDPARELTARYNVARYGAHPVSTDLADETERYLRDIEAGLATSHSAARDVPLRHENSHP
jgi:hypothetical protein